MAADVSPVVKGVVVGCVNFVEDGDFIDCTKMGVGGKAIPSLVNKITNIQGTAQFVLLVEKEAAFMRLAEDRFYQRVSCTRVFSLQHLLPVPMPSTSRSVLTVTSFPLYSILVLS